MYPRGMIGTSLPRDTHFQTDYDSTYSPPLNVTQEALHIAQIIAPGIAEEDDFRTKTMRTAYHHRSSVPDYIPSYVPSQMTDVESQKSSLSGATPFGTYLMKNAFGDTFAETCSPSTKILSTSPSTKNPSAYFPWS